MSSSAVLAPAAPDTRARTRAILQMLLCSALWSTAGILIKFIGWNGLAIAGCRSLFAAGAAAAYMRAAGIPFRFSRKAALSALFLSGTFFAFVIANKLTTSANAIVLQYTAPVFILIYQTLFRRQRPAWYDIAVVACMLGGISLFFFGDLSVGHIMGNLIALGSGLTMAGMFLAVGECTPAERMNGILLGHLLTAVIGIPFLLRCTFSWRELGICALLGIFQLGIPYVLLALASAAAPPLALSLLSSLEPLLNPVWVMLFYGEVPGLPALIGGIIVIVSITLWCVYKYKINAT